MRSTSRTLPAAVSPMPFLDPNSAAVLRPNLPNASVATVNAKVLGLFPTGFYIGVDAYPWGQQILPVLGPDALQLPTGIQVPQLTAAHLGELRTEMPATITLSTAAARPSVERVETANLCCVIVRTWRPSRVEPLDLLGPQRYSRDVVESIRERLIPGRNDLASRSFNLVRALESGIVQDVDSCVHALLGYGPGSTPSGDDALCGIALALRRTSQSVSRSRQQSLLTQRLSNIAFEARTTALSASLLRAAVEGYCIPEIEHAITDIACLGDGEDDSLNWVLANISRIGHHSGHDLLTGALAVLTPTEELTLVSPLEGTTHADDS